jgi:hypothetical protein
MVGRATRRRLPVSAAIPKQHIFGVFLDRDKWEITVDPRQLRRFSR